LSVIFFPKNEQVNYPGDNTNHYGAEVSSISKVYAALASDDKNNGCQSPLEPAPFAKDHVAPPSEDTIGQGAL
jgi:hypothetical protein